MMMFGMTELIEFKKKNMKRKQISNIHLLGCLRTGSILEDKKKK
jgi:hypothetical protein